MIDARILNPNISLGVKVPSASNAINIYENALTNNQNRKIAQAQEDRRAQQAPLNQQEQQQRIDINKTAIDEQKENRIIRSVAEFGVKLKPVLESGNTDQAISMLMQRSRDLQEQGLPVDETIDGIQALQHGDTQSVLNGVNTAQQIAQQRGLFGQNTGSAGQRELSNLLSIAQDPNSTELEKNSALRALGDKAKASGGVAKIIDIGGVPHEYDPVSKTARPLVINNKNVTTDTVGASEASIAEDVTTAEEKVKTMQTGRRGAISKAVDFASNASDKLINYGESSRVYQEAIDALNGGANTGQIYAMLPTFDTDSILLDNIASRSGFELAKSGGGIITDADMKFGLRTAIPQNLPPEELKEFLRKKIEVQNKISSNLNDAILFLGGGDKTLKDWYKEVKKNKNKKSVTDMSTEELFK